MRRLLRSRTIDQQRHGVRAPAKDLGRIEADLDQGGLPFKR